MINCLVLKVGRFLNDSNFFKSLIIVQSKKNYQLGQFNLNSKKKNILYSAILNVELIKIYILL